MQTYKEKIAPGIELLANVSLDLNSSDVDWAHELSHQLFEAEDLLLNPFQTVPAERYIHCTSSFCQPNGDSYKAHNDIIVEFTREITAAALYVKLQEYIRNYEPHYTPQVSLKVLEDWLNEQKALYKTAKHYDLPGCLEDTGLTIGDFKTNYGSIDFFIEYGITYEER